MSHHPTTTCPLCGQAKERLTSLGVCSWCDNTQGETPDPDSDLGLFLANRDEAADRANAEAMERLRARAGAAESACRAIREAMLGRADLLMDLPRPVAAALVAAMAVALAAGDAEAEAKGDRPGEEHEGEGPR